MDCDCKTKLLNYKDVQEYLDCLCTCYGTDIADAPHGAFWDDLTYEQFTTGDVPNVTPEFKILEIGSSANSNIIQILNGTGPASDMFGQMPADGTGPFTSDQIDVLANWIDAGCPNP